MTQQISKSSAIRLHEAGKLIQAQQMYQQLLESTPVDGDLWHRLGILYWQQNQLELAKNTLCQAVNYQTKSPMLWLHYGVILGLLNQHQLAQKSFESALACQTTVAQQIELYYYHALALHKQNQSNQALNSLDKLLQLSPNHVQALNLQGTLYLQNNHLRQALNCYQLAIKLKADFAEAWYHCGIVLEKLQDYSQAIKHYQHAISLKPNYLKALHNCANVYAMLQNYSQAILLLTQLLAIEPDYPYAKGRLFYWQMQNCDWQNYHTAVIDLRQGVTAQNYIIAPFEFFNVPANAQEQYWCAQAYVDKNYPQQVLSLWQGEIYRHTKIKIAYLSADFYQHATSILMIELFEKHDRSQFEWIALAFNSQNDAMTERVKAAFDRYIDVSKYTDLQIAELIKSLEIDIAVDLKGHTQDARLAIFAYKAAPIQVNYLGTASTIGASYIDYVLADAIVAPLDETPFFAEKIVHLPHTYYINDSQRPIDKKIFTRAELGLPTSGFVFCCFNNCYKISPIMFDVWMRLLQQIPDSVLWLLEGNATTRQHLVKEAQRRGVAPERLIFAPKIASHMHLARLQQADLFLDTLPINAHTTACDALWARVPVLTCTGQTFASRVAASILTAVGLPELITDNLPDYEALAVTLANSPVLIKQMKKKLQYRELSPLFDINNRRIAFESAYKVMYQRYQQGLEPQAFKIE